MVKGLFFTRLVRVVVQWRDLRTAERQGTFDQVMYMASCGAKSSVSVL